MNEFGGQISFKELFDMHQRVQIPMIQRDYAQGRESEKEVRDEFLDVLYRALNLPPDDESLPLNLDFIYGSVEGDGQTKFLPLDGQQRLTTLFLLHWYLAWRDLCLEQFRSMFCPEGYSRFSYKVRPSSSEFFDALVGFVPEDAPDTVVSLSALLTNQSWYYRNWRLDPTVQSALSMLDAIHLRFKKTPDLFTRITSIEQPAITFQLLNLENFGLSDDLYIKMNARGKPLTAFENFKARFEQNLSGMFRGKSRKMRDQEVSVAEYFSRQMDAQWADFFWPYRDKKTNVFDEAVMNLFRTVILLTRAPEGESFIEDVSLLRDGWRKNSYSFFHQHGWLDLKFSEMLILVLDTWTNDNSGFALQLPDSRYFAERAAFTKGVTEPENFGYEELVQFFAYALFLKEYEGNIDSEAFQEWMRIVFNLSVNTEYNRPADLQRSFAGLLSLAPNMKNILRHFAYTEKPVAGFNQQQITEEKIKARLIVERPDWRPLIDQAEGHGYFRGQIDFLLDFSGVVAMASAGDTAWPNTDHPALQTQFSDFSLKAQAMFTSKGLNELPDFRWERALLCIGDYLLPRGSNHSFLINSQTEPVSWKRLLRDPGSSREMLHQLWDRIDGTSNLSEQLDAIISGAQNLEPWREAFVQTPEAIEYCYQRFIRRNSDHEVYLLQRKQMNGSHAELFTYCLYRNIMSALDDKGLLAPLRLLGYQSQIGTDIEPGISLQFLYGNDKLRFEIESRRGQFIIYIPSDRIAMHIPVETILRTTLGFEEQNSVYIKEVAPDRIEAAVLELSEKLGATPKPEQNTN